jgi:DNA-binding response OmpR family regulator
MNEKNFREKSALIIEDDSDLASMFAFSIQQAGFSTEVKLLGQQAMDYLEDHTPDVVILDLHLPDIPGADVLHRIRAQQETAEIRVIIITANPGMAENLQTEADLILIKPTSMYQLRSLVARLLPED